MEWFALMTFEGVEIQPGPGDCLVVAEAGQCMNGSVDVAIEMARRADDAGAWGFKVQLLQPETIATADAGIYWNDALGNTTQRDSFRRAGLIPYRDWHHVKEACDDLGLVFLATPFDIEAVDALEAIGCVGYKIASGDITYRQLISRIAETARPIILSTGASTHEDVKRALDWIQDDVRVTLLACTLQYPAGQESAGLARIERLRGAFSCHVGYSDHTSSSATAMAAAACGSVLNEVHYTLDHELPDVPDHAIAVDPEQLREYVTYAHHGAKMRQAPEKEIMTEEADAFVGARRSCVAAHPIWAGDKIEITDVAYLRPGGGAAPYEVDHVVGKVATRSYRVGEQLNLGG